MSTGLWVLLALVTAFAVTFWVIRVKLLGKAIFPHLTQFKSLKQKRSWWVGALVFLSIIAIWWFWSDLVSLQNSLLGPNVPMWWYVVGIAVVIIIIWLFRMNKEARDRSYHMAEWLIAFTALGGALIIFSTWEKKDALCPDKQAITAVPATGMVLDLQACWDEPFMVLNLRETGIPKLAFNDESSVLRGRAVSEFARMQTNIPGATDGQARIVFDRDKMMRLGITELPVFIAPANYQPGAVPHFDEATLEALSK